MKTEIVAEVGINHNGSLATAKDMIRVAKDCGADTCKFQMFDPEMSCDGDRALYRILAQTRLSLGELSYCKSLCDGVGIGFLCSAFDRRSIDCLVEIGETRVKIPSSRNTVREYLDYLATKPFGEILIANGAANARYIDSLSFLFPGKRVVSIECISAYPCDPSKFVFWQHSRMQPWGLSDHSLSWEADIAAVAKGACYIEKHFTIDQSAKGPDHRASLSPNEFTEMVDEIRNVERMLANTDKVVLPEEQATVARKARHNVDQYK